MAETAGNALVYSMTVKQLMHIYDAFLERFGPPFKRIYASALARVGLHRPKRRICAGLNAGQEVQRGSAAFHRFESAALMTLAR